jgi:hypothetical protein
MEDKGVKFRRKVVTYKTGIPMWPEEIGFSFTKEILGGADCPHGEIHYDYEPPDVINTLTNLKKNVNYLEIGVDQGNTFNKIENTNLKHGVDPWGACENISHKMTSQLFFSMNNRFFHNRYDIIFIDGMHLVEFVHAEILESFKILKQDGLIVLHDTCPYYMPAQLVIEEEYRDILDSVISRPEKNRLKWHENTKVNDPIGYNGDAWKIVPWLRTLQNFTIFSIPNACITIISTKKMPAFESEHVLTIEDIPKNTLTLPWEYYFQNFETIMNPYTMDYFKANIGKYL